MGNANGLPSTPHSIEFAGAENARLFFSGPPQALKGTIPLINTGGEKQKITSLGLNAKDLQGPAQIPLRQFPFSVKLYPGEQASVPGTITIDPRTPPGSYDIELQIGDRVVPATAYVTEVVDLRIEPSQMTILAGAGTSYVRRIVAENRGNVQLPTGASCEAPIFDSIDLVGGMLIGLHKADKSSVESMVKGFLQEWSELQAGTLVTSRNPMILYPGQKVAVDIEFQLPPELKPLRHYHANLQLYNATLAVDIYTTAKTGSEVAQKDAGNGVKGKRGSK